MSSQKDLLIKISANADQLLSELKKGERSIGSFNTLVGGLSVAAVGAFTKELINSGLQMEKMNRLFTAAAGSASLGAREFEYVREISRKMGLDILSTADSYGRFIAAIRGTSLEGEAGRKVFESVSSASTALGLSADETSGIFNALQQMMSKGKVQAEELRGQLGERLPGAYKMAADAMGLTTAQLGKQLEAGTVMAEDLLPKLAVELDKTYGQAAKEGASSAAAELNRFNNAMVDFKSTAGATMIPVLTDLLVLITPVVEGLKGLVITSREVGLVWNAMGAKAGIAMKGGPLGINWLTKSGRAEIAAEMDAYNDLVAANMLKFEARFSGNGSDYTAAEKARQKKSGGAAGPGSSGAAVSSALKKEAREAETAFQRYSTAFDSLIQKADDLNPNLTETEKKLAGINAEVDKLVKANPLYADSLQEAGDWLKKSTLEAERFKEEMRQIGLSIKELEESTSDMPGFGKMGLEPDAGFLGIDTKVKPNSYSLTGPSSTPTRWGDVNLQDTKQEYDALLSLQQDFENQKNMMQLDAAEQSLNIMKNAFRENKELAFAFLLAEKALAVTRIMIATEVAAAAAIAAAAMTMVPGAAALGVAQAASIRTMGAISVGLVIAGGVVEASQLAGERANGGPVLAGKRYLVGEKGPEILTMGSTGGHVTPNHAIGGGVIIQQSFSVTGVGAELTQNMKLVARQAGEQAKAEILNSMNRGGSFALASGRR